MLLKLRGSFSLIALALTCLLANAAQMLSLLVQPFSPKAFRACNRRIVGAWWSFLVWTIERVHGVRLIVTGDPLPRGERAIVVANHQEMTDILALLCLSRRSGAIGDMKWFVKDIIKYAPMIGWGMLFIDCVFLKRDWAADRSKVERTFSNLVTHDVPFWMVSFVEGTRIKPAKLASSQEFARGKGLPVLKNLLLPRTKGFTATVLGLREKADAVYDVTIGYEGPAPSLWRFASTRVERVHLNVRRFPLDTLPSTEEGLSKWLVERFTEKDALLEGFRRDGAFVGGAPRVHA